MRKFLLTIMTLMALMFVSPSAHATEWFDVLSNGGETIAVNPDITTTDNGVSYLVLFLSSGDAPM